MAKGQRSCGQNGQAFLKDLIHLNRPSNELSRGRDLRSKFNHYPIQATIAHFDPLLIRHGKHKHAQSAVFFWGEARYFY